VFPERKLFFPALWSNIFLADQDERQRCFFADQKQFPADH
jgi:hypothetical protein